MPLITVIMSLHSNEETLFKKIYLIQSNIVPICIKKAPLLQYIIIQITLSCFEPILGQITRPQWPIDSFGIQVPGWTSSRCKNSILEFTVNIVIKSVNGFFLALHTFVSWFYQFSDAINAVIVLTFQHTEMKINCIVSLTCSPKNILSIHLLNHWIVT